MLIQQTNCSKPRRRGRRRVRSSGGGVRLGLLLRLRVRLSGIVGLLVRSMEELRCYPGRGKTSCSTSRARRPALSLGGSCRRRPAPAERNQSSFYNEAIADCLEFIKSRSTYLPAKDDKIVSLN
ncbi:hypothetical protein CFC21_110384 [Triticum aestivum]|uniref:Uncharacterized protein n=2 Tax=Triticum aestivum TaxID=4565 RepID=A0A3B6TP01_WHEAT|nr:uncharacterized protein LOC120969475 [Aegilops tauschii subsp. strangulata]KAF7110248.1 hypothetical protein CFC21_110384 [Triticum aestivum]